jgi:hypothetical protein
MATLYDVDFLKWIDHQAAALRARRWNELDVEHLAEEVESLGRSQRRELQSRVRVILQHLLKGQRSSMQPSWASTIAANQIDLAALLEDNPSLRREVPDAIQAAYPTARRLAAVDMSVPINEFPAICPFTPEEVLGRDG